MDNSSWGLFALVCYVPEPLHSFVERVRHSLPGEYFPQPHLTLLPPRWLRTPVDQASEWARSILPRFSAFSVQLSSVQTFPQSNVLYLTASDEERKLFQIHSALNSGPLFDEERYEFRPHLTLGGPIEPSALPAARNAAETAWAEYREERQFTVDELVALSGTAGTEQSERVTWNRLWNYSLSASRWKAAGAAGQPSG